MIPTKNYSIYQDLDETEQTDARGEGCRGPVFVLVSLVEYLQPSHNCIY